MVIGNIGFLICVVFPAFQIYRGKQKTEQAVEFPLSMVIELCLYEMFSALMVWSHLATMLVEPGFVPLAYQYKDDSLPMIYKITLQKGLIIEEESREPIGTKSFQVKRPSNDKEVPNIQPQANDSEIELPVMSKSIMEKRLAYLQNEDGPQSQVVQKGTDEHSGASSFSSNSRIHPERSHAKSFDARQVLSPKQQSEIRLKYERACKQCRGVKPPRAHHCSVCGRCVMKMDHHCPWMNNCIGLNNQKAFMCFNFYVTVCAAWTTIRIIVSIFQCTKEKDCTVFKKSWVIVITIVSLLLCALFALFTCVMFCDQSKLICEESSTIDNKQLQRQIKQAQLGQALPSKHKQRRISKCEAIRAVMGPNPLYWFIPMNIGIDLSIENQLNNPF